MKEKIRAKMETHIKSILDKPIITNDEYMIICGYLNKLETEEQLAESKKSAAESSARLKAAMDLFSDIKQN